MTAPEVRVGTELRVVEEDALGIELQGTLKLQPGRTVLLRRCASDVPRAAVVWTWWLRRLDRHGATYEGRCQWA